MILKEAIEQISDDEVFCIGAKSSFLFIGTKAEWEADKGLISWKYTDEAEQSIRHSRHRAEAEQRKIDSGESKSKKYLRRAMSHAKTKQEYLDGFIPFDEREIKKIYVRDLFFEKVIIVKGMEEGRYWFKSEYEEEEGKRNYEKKKMLQASSKQAGNSIQNELDSERSTNELQQPLDSYGYFGLLHDAIRRRLEI